MAGNHAEIFPPSSAQRRILCPGSAVLERGRERAPTSYASSGSATHKVAEWCLTEGTEAAAYIGRVISVDGFDNDVTAERAKRAQDYVDAVRDLHKAVGGELLVELGGDDGADDTRGKTGGAKTGGAFATLGVQLRDAKGAMRATEDVLTDTGLAIAKLGSAQAFARGGFALTSPAFNAGEPLDPSFTATEEDAVAPPLEWSAPPPGSRWATCTTRTG